jgi:ATP-dependent protease ClpP protease subunit
MKRSWFNLAFDEETKTADIYLYNDIGFFGVSANDFKEQLLSVNAQDLNIYINSMGGDVTDGLAIFNLIQRHSGKKTVHIDGMAASIASVIAMAGDEVIMPETSLMFVHKPWTITAGNAEDLQRTAEHLDKTEAAIIAAYTQKTGRDAAFISDMMRDERTLSAAEAIELGFADKLIQDEPVTEFAYAGAMMNRVMCRMNKSNGAKNSMETPEEIAPVEIAPAIEPVAEVPSEPVVEAIETPPEAEPVVTAEPASIDPLALARAELDRYAARFGDVRAVAYLREGLAFDAAERRFTDELIAENESLKAKQPAQASAGPVPVKPSDTNDIVAQFASITDPAERTKFYKQNAKALWKVSKK